MTNEVSIVSVNVKGYECPTPNFAVTLRKNRLLHTFFHAERENCKITFRKRATAQDVQTLIDFCAYSFVRILSETWGKRRRHILF